MCESFLVTGHARVEHDFTGRLSRRACGKAAVPTAVFKCQSCVHAGIRNVIAVLPDPAGAERSSNRPIVTFTARFLDTTRGALQQYLPVHSDTSLTAQSPGAEAATVGRLPVDIRRFPCIRRLASGYAFDYSRLADFFAGDPGDPAAWRDAIARVSSHPRPRDAVVEVLHSQQRRREAPAEAVTAAARLADSASVAVVTGQQAGLFGGPLFTLLKALTAIQLAERVRSEHRVRAVAVFWVDAEDHDWNEVKACRVLNAEQAPRSVSVGDLPGAHAGPVARVRLNDSIATALSELQSALPGTEFTPALL